MLVGTVMLVWLPTGPTQARRVPCWTPVTLVATDWVESSVLMTCSQTSQLPMISGSGVPSRTSTLGEGGGAAAWGAAPTACAASPGCAPSSGCAAPGGPRRKPPGHTPALALRADTGPYAG